MSVIPEDYAQVNVQFNGSGLIRNAEVVFGVANASSLSAVEVADGVRLAWIAHFAELQVNTCHLFNVRAKLGPNADGPTADVAASQNGTLAESIESSQVAYLFRKDTALGGRWNRGRMFMPGASESRVDDGGSIDADFLVTMATQADLFLEYLIGIDLQMVVLHSEFSSEKVDGVTTRVPNPHADDPPRVVLSLTPQSIVATQRRRLRK